MEKGFGWAEVGVVVAIISAIGTVLYNRWINYGKLVEKQTDYNMELKMLKAMFEQYQRDIQHYLDICELCRSEVRGHHENRTAEHVTPAMRDQINSLVSDVSDIKRFLMERAK
jgi:uncharacterized membrane-anchored protein YhcB (DUF1043 family)